MSMADVCRSPAKEIAGLQMTAMAHSNAAMVFAKTPVIAAPQPPQVIQTMRAKLSRITVNCRAFAVELMASVNHADVMRKTRVVKANAVTGTLSSASQLLNTRTQNMEALRVAT